MKACFSPHVLMHSLFGLGLGVLLVSLMPQFGMVWIGLILMLASVLLDWMRK